MTLPTKKHTAVIFDMDGVIIDSIPHHKRAWEQVHHSLNLPFSDEVFESLNGMRNDEVFGELLGIENHSEAERLAIYKEDSFRQSARESLQFIEGFPEFLQFLHSNGIKTAVATSAPRENIEMVHEVLGLFDMVNTLVSSEDVAHGKPAPDVFLAAASRIGAESVSTVVFEDSLSGILAGKNAGMTVVGLATTHDPNQLEMADFIVKHFGDTTLRQLF